MKFISNSKTIEMILFSYMLLLGNMYGQEIFNAPELIGRVSDHSLSINAATNEAVEYYYEYGVETGIYNIREPESDYFTSLANEPFEVTLEGLLSNTRYYYRLVYRLAETSGWIMGEEHRFHTQRSNDSGFVFTIVSDSHQSADGPAQPRNLYHQTLSNVEADNPDLHFDLGDSFAMTTLEIGDTTGTRAEYLSQRSSLGIISHSTPIYLIVGNHEEEEGWNLDDAGADVDRSKPVMSINARKKYFLNPIPDSFFTGNADDGQPEIEDDHLRENYYSFEWGDALFVGIDPYANTMTKPFPGTGGGEQDDEVVGDRWDWTLGEDQYRWLKETLESSSAKWKFIFSHQVVGGISDYGRGGAVATSAYEWGAGANAFSAHRPNWSYNTSIHQLMLDNDVTIFFHGHDHVYAREEIDGMIYQECPQPSDLQYSSGFNSYQNDESTVVVNNSGHIRVSVSPEALTVDYIRAYLPGAGSNGSIGHSYTISSTSSTEPNNPQLISSFELYQNYPNPFNPSTTIRYGLPEEANVSLVIYDVRSQVVQTLESEHQSAGWYDVVWNGQTADGRTISTGIYFARLVAGEYSQVVKMLYLK